MNGTSLQFALRELQRAYSSRRGLAVMAVVAVLLGIAGPFGTFALTIGTRIVYWASIVFVTYGVGLFFGMLVLFHLRPPLRTPPFSILIIGLVASLPIFLAVVALGWLFMGRPPVSLDAGIVLQWAYCFIAATGVSAVLVMAERGDVAAAAPALATAAPEPPAILGRLPLAQRGRLLALSMQDHYVEVATDKGRVLVLMRLGDAIAETAPVAGLQIHRSHWVALEAVSRSGRSEGRGFVELSDGTRLPISRGYIAAAKSAGLLS